ncbi:RNA polymerase sigma-E factor [Sphaerisporangium melleum]|uniref:RNA polymerase sigma-E factor n=1 Tax=Sphaerisporangium melleum TaxID=321316 RepID=A0A917QYH3_9ACTN|nr:SigE family RNA polymerase sigma factor [Sphaerisporangium melleum]GGK77383.1 RNA polymerase sigma-E factor [Sphaerisporangium melleum]GII71843.1 RNA polymerase sigma-E factor [Sphaerisporangium melleum]
MQGGFDDYVSARYGRLRHAAYLLTGDRASAEDLVQTALAKAWVAWRRIEGDPDPYVRRIIVNTHASWWRRKWRHQEVPADDLPERPGTADHADEVGSRHALLAAMKDLTRQQRAVIVLHYFEDLTLVQCADVLGCTVGTVKAQLSRALKRLRVQSGTHLKGVGR